MLKILLPVDGSDNALRAAEHVVMLATNHLLLTCDILYVSHPFGYRVHAYRSPEQVAKMEEDEAHSALRGTQAIFDAAGIVYAVAREEGDIALHIVAHARQVRCDLVVMGMRGMGLVVGPVSMGSVTSKVLHAADIAVTLVR